MSCLFIWQEELGTSPGVLMISRALELIPLQVQYVYLQMLTIWTSPEIFFTRLIFLPTGSGRYIPGSGPNPSGPVGVADPFTGESLMIHLWQLFSGRHMYFRWYKAILFWTLALRVTQIDLYPSLLCRRRRLLLGSPQTDSYQHLLPQDWRCYLWASQQHADHLWVFQVLVWCLHEVLLIRLSSLSTMLKILNWSNQKELNFPSSKSQPDMHVDFEEAIHRTSF